MGVEASEDFKQCPECAETVRAQARVCRFCGYRFEEPVSTASAVETRQAKGRGSSEQGKPSSVRELLSEWGSELEDGEHVAFFVAAQATGVSEAPTGVATGFLLITDRRLAFYAPHKRSIIRIGRDQPPGAAIVVERRHGDASNARVVTPRLRRPQLQIGDRLTLKGIPRSMLKDIKAFLAERSP